jgi:hypothetical protein
MKQFYNYVNKRLGRTQVAPRLVRGADTLSDVDAANAFLTEFSNHFTRDSPTTYHVAASAIACATPLLLNCSSNDIKEALTRCADTTAGPDSFSYKLIKRCFHELLKPLVIIFQQSLVQGIFPTSWKTANITPLYC